MPPKRFFVLASLLFVCNSLWGQQQTVPAKFAATFGPALLPLSSVRLGLQPGVHYNGGRWGVSADYTFPLHKPRNEFAAIQYNRFGLQVKRYVGSNDLYVSLQTTYALRRFTDTNGGVFFRSHADDRYSYSKARIHSPVFTVAANVGVEAPFTKKLFLDVACGFGVRTIHTRYSQVEDEIPTARSIFGRVGPIASYQYAQSLVRLHVTANIRLGYVLW